MIHLNRLEGYVIKVDENLFLGRNAEGVLGFYDTPFIASIISEENKEDAFKLMMEQQATQPEHTFVMLKAVRYILMDTEDEPKEIA